jgi:Domain of unknown function (DUF3598)
MIARTLIAAAALAVAASADAKAVSAADRAERAVMVAQMQGIWNGTFRRYAPDGSLVETLPSKIEVRFPRGADHDYHQTNVLTLADGKEQRLETFGRWDGRVLRYSSARIDGSFARAAEDPTGLSSVLFMQFKDGSGMTVSEIVTVSPDGTRRMRAAQYIANGKLLRRTLIDETRAAR